MSDDDDMMTTTPTLAGDADGLSSEDNISASIDEECLDNLSFSSDMLSTQKSSSETNNEITPFPREQFHLSPIRENGVMQKFRPRILRNQPPIKNSTHAVPQAAAAFPEASEVPDDQDYVNQLLEKNGGYLLLQNPLGSIMPNFDGFFGINDVIKHILETEDENRSNFVTVSPKKGSIASNPKLEFVETPKSTNEPRDYKPRRLKFSPTC